MGQVAIDVPMLADGEYTVLPFTHVPGILRGFEIGCYAQVEISGSAAGRSHTVTLLPLPYDCRPAGVLGQSRAHARVGRLLARADTGARVMAGREAGRHCDEGGRGSVWDPPAGGVSTGSFFTLFHFS